MPHSIMIWDWDAAEPWIHVAGIDQFACELRAVQEYNAEMADRHDSDCGTWAEVCRELNGSEAVTIFTTWGFRQ